MVEGSAGGSGGGPLEGAAVWPWLAFLGGLFAVDLGPPVRDVAHDVEARDSVLLEQRDGVAVGLGEDGHEHVMPLDLVFAGRANVRVGAANDALDPEG